MEKPLIIYLSEKNNQFNLSLEGKGGILKRTFYYIFISFLNILPHRYGKHIILERSEEVKATHQHRAKTLALELIYNHKRKPILSPLFIGNIVYNLMCNVESCRATRNRLKIVTYFVKKFIIEKKYNNNISLTSIAAGSARSIIEALAETSADIQKEIHATFIDKDEYAINYSKDLVKKFSFPEQYKFAWIQCSVSQIKDSIKPESQHIIEMVGLLDYFDFDKSISIIRDTVFSLLAIGGYFIIANVRKNREVPFVSNLFQWRMYYKEPLELYNILLQAGFSPDGITLIADPLKIHTIAIAKKK